MDTPGYPKAPHSTPSSTHGHHPGLYNLKRPRPPIQNPFDKFSQQDFDVWIGKLTGDLEKALGYEEVIQSQPSLPQATEQTDDGYDDSDSYVEDSFAEVKARRVLDKGKARDPREGPGLGPKSGDVEQPIEILSDDESEDEGEQLLDFEGSAEGEPDESYEEAKEDGGVDERGRGEDGSENETETWSRRQRRIHSTAGESTRRPIRDDSEVLESGSSGSDEYEDDEEADVRRLNHAQGSKGVIRLSSDEEVGTARRRRRQEEELEEEAFLSEEDAEVVDSSPAPARGQLHRQELQDEEEMQPSDEDTSFPPHSVNIPSDIRDPWAPVARYAEDYYSGGNVVSDGRIRLNPHHLSNEDDSGFLTPDVVNADIGVKEEDDEEEEEEEGEGEDEFEDDFIKDDPEDMETQDFEPEPDENDHLFNRLRSYTQPNPAVYSPWRGPRTSFVVMGPGSNEEPIMIDSDDELEEPTDHYSKVITPNLGRSEEVISTLEAQDKGRSLQLMDEQISTRALEQLEVPLPQIPSESSFVPGVPGQVRVDTGTSNNNSDAAMAADNVPGTPKDLALHTHGSVDTSSPIPDLKYPGPTPAPPSNLPTVTGDDVSQALDQMAGQQEAATHATTDISTELDIFGQDTVVREDDEELDELDELDDGPWPLMTSDLDYPHDSQTADVKDGSERDSVEPSETMSNDGNTFSSPTSEVESAEQKNSPDIHIFVEEVDEEPRTSFNPITINIQPPTPLIMSELEFQISPTSLNEASSPDNVRSELSGHTSPTLHIPTETFVMKEATIQHIDTGSHDNVETPDQGFVSGEKTLQTDEIAEGVEEVGTTNIVTLGYQESMYVVEESVIGSEFDEVRHDRGISIDIASAVSDDMISTVENGHVEEAFSDTNLEEIQSSGVEAEGVHVEELHSFTGARETDIEEVTVTTTIEVPVVARTTPEAIEEDYFARASTPIMPLANLDGRDDTPAASGILPSIIQLPDTPQRVLSPGSTPGPGPTPVSIAVEPGILKVLKENPSFFSATSSPPPISEHLRQSPVAETAFSEINLSSIENTISQQPSPQPPSSRTSSCMHPDSSEQLPSNYPTFLPVTTTIKPVLYVDPYPYSLSTPLPYSHQEEDGYEDATEHDNSFSPSPNEKELDSNVNTHVPALEPSGPGEQASNLTEVAHGAHNAQIDNSKTERSLVEVEAEADALIDEFLIDEPESDTDADGEADPDFTAPESGGSARTSEELKGKGPEEQVPLTTNASEVSEATVKEAVAKEDVKEDIGTQEDARDVQMNVDQPGNSFQPTGIDISMSSLEALDVERTGKSEEKTETAGTDEANLFDAKTVPISEVPVEIPAAETVRASPPPQVHPLRNTSPGGALSMSAGEHVTSTSPLQTNVIQNDSPLDVNAGLIDSLQQKEPSSNLPLEQTENTQARSLVTLPRIITEGVPPTAREGSPCRVQVSLEDPYNADNDTDREQKSNASRIGKRKRSLSVASNGESPIAPRSTSIAKGKGKTSRQSSKGTSRPRKKPSLLSSSIASRSPSVASTVVSDVSSLLSPSYPSLPSTDPRPFIHAHSRRKLGNAPRTVQQQRHKQQQKAVPGSRSQDGVLRAENVLTKAPSGPLVPGSSPMTRSHCRYHKISIPKTENGPRIHFLVPGCSLNDAELIEEEEIEDLGEAIIRGDTVIADKIETINFEPYLLWAMRQLVGTELLRENEVYYLPEPNETVVRTTQESKKKGARPGKRQSKRADEGIAGPSQKPAPLLPSDISSVGSAASALRQVIAGLDDDDMSSITETEEEEDTSLGPQKEGEQNPPGKLDVSPSKSEASAATRKRIRRLGQDAAAYHPSSGEESVSELSDTAHKSSRHRGVKRPRASESSVTGAEGRKVKMTKRQSSSSPGPSHAETTQHVFQRSPSHPDHLTEIRPSSSGPMINPA